MRIYSVFFLMLASIYSIPAMAYIDPGSGSAIMSAIIGAVVATGMVIKTYWYKLKSLFMSTPPAAADQAEEDKED